MILVLCGLIGMAEVRAPADWCPVALAVSRDADLELRRTEHVKVHAAWALYFTPDEEYADGGRFLRAYTLCPTHTVFVSMHHPRSILHELYHAVDCEAGEWTESRLHWGWRAKGRHVVESRFNPEGITWHEGGK